MLIGDSTPKLLFTRSVIITLRLIAPASLAYCLIYPIIRPHEFFQRPLPLPFSIWAVAESGFFLVIYLPLKALLQREADHPKPPPKSERQLLFQRCLDSVSDLKEFLSGWFFGCPLPHIDRENVKEFYAWSLMNKKYDDVDDAQASELGEYVEQLEGRFNQRIGSAPEKRRSLRGTMQHVYMQPRPLLWYLVS